MKTWNRVKRLALCRSCGNFWLTSSKGNKDGFVSCPSCKRSGKVENTVLKKARK